MEEYGPTWLLYEKITDRDLKILEVTPEDVESLVLSTVMIEEKEITNKQDITWVIETINKSKLLGRRIFQEDNRDGNYTCDFTFRLKDGEEVEVQALSFRIDSEESENSVFLLQLPEDGKVEWKYNGEYFFQGELIELFWELYQK